MGTRRMVRGSNDTNNQKAAHTSWVWAVLLIFGSQKKLGRLESINSIATLVSETGVRLLDNIRCPVIIGCHIRLPKFLFGDQVKLHAGNFGSLRLQSTLPYEQAAMKQKSETSMTSKFAALWGLLRTFLVSYCVPGKRFRLTRLYQQFITEGMLCFDIGSHYGNRIPVWSQLGASVVAIEPQPILYKFLVRFYAKRKNIRLLQAVISDQDGDQTLFHNTKNPSLSSIDKAWIVEKKGDPIWGNYQWDAEISVKAYTLDQLIDVYGKPGFCKIDVEGAEYKVLAGLSIPLNCISFEYLTIDKERTLACIKRLEVLGEYRYNWTISEKSKLMSSTWLTAQDMKDVVQNMDGTYSGDIYAQYRVNET